MKPGVYERGVCDYDAIVAERWSHLKMMGKSPKHYRHITLNPRKDTAALRRGRAGHTATFEPERFAHDYVIYAGDKVKEPRGWDAFKTAVCEPDRFLAEYVAYDGAKRSGKDWTAFKEAYAGKTIVDPDELAAAQAVCIPGRTDRTILTPQQHQTALDIREAVLADPLAAHYLGRRGRHELTSVWVDEATGILCKARHDFMGAALVELKTSAEVDTEDFGRKSWKYGYVGQVAWNVDGYRQACGEMVPAVLICAEAQPPYDVVVYPIDEEDLTLGREVYRGLLTELAQCRERNEWPGVARGAEMKLQLPRWVRGYDADEPDEGVQSIDISELGLEGL